LGCAGPHGAAIISKSGICRDDEIAIACVDGGRVLANLRSNEQARIMLWQMPQQRSRMLKRKFADWKNLLRFAASHASRSYPVRSAMVVPTATVIPAQKS
jgi:hypothetical protein